MPPGRSRSVASASDELRAPTRISEHLRDAEVASLKTRLVALAAVAVLALPYAVLAIASTAPRAAFRQPFAPLAPAPTLENYRTVFGGDVPFGRYVRNSAVVSTIATVLALAAAAPAAHAIARRRVPVAPALAALVGLSLLPQAIVLGPAFVGLRAAGLLGTHAGLGVLYAVTSIPLAVLLLAAAIADVPREVEEAAAVDGCRPLSALVRVTLPAAAPGVAAAALLVFMNAWNEFLYALVLLPSPVGRTATVGIALFPGRYEVPWGTLFAAAVVATAPLVLLALALQRRIVRGLTGGAVVG